MRSSGIKTFFAAWLCLTAVVFTNSCSTTGSGQYYGRTTAPAENHLRYVSGSEPQSLDPAVPTGQPEARVIMALFDGLVEYHPKSMEPMPAIAESWEASEDGTEYLFYLRKNATFSNGVPITAKDFDYSFKRALSPELAAENAYLAYYIKYAQPYNSGAVFVKKADGTFVHQSDVDPDGKTAETASATADTFGGDTPKHRQLDEPLRLTLPGGEKERGEVLEKDAKLKALVDGKEFVTVTADDLGFEVVDDHTFRIKLLQPAPYFIGLLAHQYFRVVHKDTIDKFGTQWTKPENIVTSGAFRLAVHRPYDELNLTKDPTYWDAANVHLDRLDIYPLEDQTTMQNLYKAGSVDATYNHTIPAGWIDNIKQYKDEYLNLPEAAIQYYSINVRKKPMDDVKVRKAFALAIDRVALARFRKTLMPLTDFTPEGIFPRYEEARKKVYGDLLKKDNITPEQWEQRMFDPEGARKLLVEAGYPVEQRNGVWIAPTFPVENVNVVYNTSESNKAIAEFLQAQWKQNLGITVPLNNMEWKTFLPTTKALDYSGFARRGWVADYMDPFTFLALFYTEKNDSATGWHNPKYDKLLDDANRQHDAMRRYEMLAEAEYMVMRDQVVVPLATNATNWIKKPYVKGLYPNAGTVHAWKFVYIERDPAKWDKDVENIMEQNDPMVDDQITRLMQTQVDRENASKTATMASAK
ncbi:MAG: peptide ABC transporter substrate-binding protein [Acidobacteria bacterium]|nr:peptide ABC transporter substrate-binding protein [Acidobacteriota bacterium]